MNDLPSELRDPPARDYLFVCLGGLLVVLLGLVMRGYGLWALAPVLAGLLTLVVRWHVGPLLVLVVLTGQLFVTIRSPQVGVPRAADLFLCLGLLAYVAGHYRLQGFTGGIFPKDGPQAPARRNGDRGPEPLADRPRPPRTASPGELLLLLASLPLWVGLALVAYPWLVPLDADRRQSLHFDAMSLAFEAALRCRFVVLLFGVAVLTLWGVAGAAAWRNWTPDEARLALQDAVWSQTRGEERRINVWRMWARWRRKGGS